MKNSKLYFLIFFCLGLISCKHINMHNTSDINSIISTGIGLLSTITLDEKGMIDQSRFLINQIDAKEKILPLNSKYTQRINYLTRRWRTVNNRYFNYAVYKAKKIQAFSMPDGSIRIYSGLMDLMNDGELMFVIGHEIGHVLSGHSLSRFKLMGFSKAIREVSNKFIRSNYSSTNLDEFLEKLINAQYSQANEYEADDYGLAIVRQAGFDPSAAVSALRGLASVSGYNYNVVQRAMASHPAPGDRARRIERRIYGY